VRVRRGHCDHVQEQHLCHGSVRELNMFDMPKKTCTIYRG
jgi:hypothetical protein